MKKLFLLFVLLCLLVSFTSLAEDIDELIPDSSMWGMSRTAIEKNIWCNYKECIIGKSKGLKLDTVEVAEHSMDPYYVFNERMWNSEGKTYKGLSKVVYVLSGITKRSTDDLKEFYHVLTEEMTTAIGEPDSSKKAVTTWKTDEYKIEIGTGKFKKYNGSDNATVAIVITALDIDKPITPKPTAKKTPKPTQKPTPKPTSIPTFKPIPMPTKTPPPKIDYQELLRNPSKYEGSHFEFEGRVFDTAYYHDHYTLLMFTKYNIALRGYYDDVYYVEVPTDDIFGGERVLNDDEIKVYGTFAGIKSYTTIRGDANHVPLVRADFVSIHMKHSYSKRY